MNMNSVLKWLSEQWNLIGFYFSFPKNPTPPVLLYILFILAISGVFFLQQPAPSIILVCWFAMMVIAAATAKKPKPPSDEQ